jgi:putative peptidoglycan lipid II flippase
LECALVAGDALYAGVLPRFRWPEFDADVKKFFRALGPATVGSAGVQLALFADTVIASFLATGALSALYYADRINQLPIGVIGIAAGTVVLPEMARRIAAGDEAGARRAQDRAIELTLLLSVPCVVAFLIVPELIMRALFARGAFTSADAAAAGQTLAAYALGLVPFVLIRSVVATFFARGDTANPVKAALSAAAVNIAFKVLLVGSLAQVGLALATSVGAWINLLIVLWLASRRGLIALDPQLRRAILKIAMAGVALAIALWVGRIVAEHVVHDGLAFRDEGRLMLLVAIGAVVYGGIVLILFGRQWFAAFRRSATPPL